MNSRRILIAIAAMSLAVAACGGGDDAGDEPAATPAPAVTEADNGGPVAAGSAEEGKTLYDGTCTACHAAAGAGVDGLGKPLANSDFIAGADDAALVELITIGRPSSDPANTTGIDMPPKGGNPSLSDADVASIVAYLRTLN